MFFYLPLLLFFCLQGHNCSGQQIDTNSRVDCAPKPGDGTPETCEKRGCIWDHTYNEYTPTVPLCYFPTNTGYTLIKTNGEMRLKKSAGSPKNPYDADIEELNLSVKNIGPSTLKVSIGKEGRYVPPVPLNEAEGLDSSERLVFKPRNDPVFSFTVERTNDQGSKLWDTSIGGLIFGDKYIQIATYLPSDRLYGFGENIHQAFKHDFTKYTTWGMLARDDLPNSRDPNGFNYYGVHPFYLCVEPSGKAHGVLIFNSNPQEVTTGPAPHLIYRTIGGQLDVFFFAGPRAEDVIQQYQKLIDRPFLPAYWALGYQLCRYGYKDVADLKATVDRVRAQKIPFDVAYSDIDYMNHFKDFSYDKTEKWKDFPSYVDELHNKGMRLILIFDPDIDVYSDDRNFDYGSFKRALDARASFVEWPSFDLVPRDIQDLYPLAKNTKIMLSVVWPDHHAAFPDFLDPTNKTKDWWANEFKLFHDQIKFDGIWIDMNEPSVLGTNEEIPSYPTGHPTLSPLKCPLTGKDSEFDSPPYETTSVYSRGTIGTSLNRTYMSTQSLCMLARTMGGASNFYNTRNIYGWSETVATSKGLKLATGKRGAVISRSTFPGSGRYGGHWLGDNTARWEDLRTAIIGVMEFNLFGIPYVGSDVCGFNLTTNEELCLRWQQLGAFHSFFRNHHNKDPGDLQDPAQWKSVAIASREANLFRYQHLPYLYSLHFRASLIGGTVIRPLFFEFPQDSITYTLNHQFMWGSSIVVVAVTNPTVESVRGYLPAGASWYSMSRAYKYGSKVASGFSTFTAPRDTPLPVFVKGGSIIPRQKPAVTTFEARKNEFQLLIALDSTTDLCTASGELFWDDGETDFESIEAHEHLHYLYCIEVTPKLTCLTINLTKGDSLQSGLKVPSLDNIEIFGYPYKTDLASAKLNGFSLKINFEKDYDPTTDSVFTIQTPSLINLNEGGPIWTVIWENSPAKNSPSNPSDSADPKSQSKGSISSPTTQAIMVVFTGLIAFLFYS